MESKLYMVRWGEMNIEIVDGHFVTEKTVIANGGRRAAESARGSYFKSFDEAEQHILNPLKGSVISAKLKLSDAKVKINRLRLELGCQKS